MKKVLYFFFFLTLLCSSCVTPRRTHYLQEPDYAIPSYPESSVPNDYVVQFNDELYIRVITLNPDSKKIFNAYTSNSSGTSEDVSSVSIKGLFTYTVYEDGTIDFPYIGSIYVEGKNTREIKKDIETKLKDYVKDCSVEVNLVNSYFSLLTESTSGRYPIKKEKMTIFEALALGGDLGPYADRSKVKILRQLSDGGNVIKEFDLRSKDVLNSDFYYIRPNDIIYVKAFDGQFFKLNSFLTVLSTTTSTISFGLLIYKIVDLCIPKK